MFPNSLHFYASDDFDEIFRYFIPQIQAPCLYPVYCGQYFRSELKIFYNGDYSQIELFLGAFGSFDLNPGEIRDPGKLRNEEPAKHILFVLEVGVEAALRKP